jgi:hypothetical protein
LHTLTALLTFTVPGQGRSQIGKKDRENEKKKRDRGGMWIRDDAGDADEGGQDGEPLDFLDSQAVQHVVSSQPKKRKVRVLFLLSSSFFLLPSSFLFLSSSFFSLTSILLEQREDNKKKNSFEEDDLGRLIIEDLDKKKREKALRKKGKSLISCFLALSFLLTLPLVFFFQVFLFDP